MISLVLYTGIFSDYFNITSEVPLLKESHLDKKQMSNHKTKSHLCLVTKRKSGVQRV